MGWVGLGVVKEEDRWGVNRWSERLERFFVVYVPWRCLLLLLLPYFLCELGRCVVRIGWWLLWRVACVVVEMLGW